MWFRYVVIFVVKLKEGIPMMISLRPVLKLVLTQHLRINMSSAMLMGC